MNEFLTWSLSETLKETLTTLGHVAPTPIQAKAIPIILDGRDIVGIAQTGTGKTGAFCLPMIELLQRNKEVRGVRALILAPTRELVSQIHLNCEAYAKNLNLKICSLYGGVDQKPQVKLLKEGCDIVVATPGRLLDLISQSHVRLAKVEIFVLDEADRMLDMGFIEDIDKIIEDLPLRVQTLLFSATMPSSVARLAKRILSSPEMIEVSPNSSVPTQVSQKVIFCKREDKFELLKKILKEEERELVVIFTKTKNSADKVKDYLIFNRIAAALFHGDKSQEDREKALGHFKNGSMKILIATDMASRGLDIQGISHVINFELPLEAENYVHRIGRTARAGKDGIAITFCEESEKPILERIEILLNVKIPSEKFKTSPQAGAKWSESKSVKKVVAPTPGKSQEKSAYLDHSKRQRPLVEGAPKSKPHPGFKKKKR